MSLSSRLTLVAILAFVPAGCTSTLRLSPVPLLSQQAAETEGTELLASQQFHTVVISPHSVEAKPGTLWRFYIQLKNGSALDTTFDPLTVRMSLNETILPILSKDAIRRRILHAREDEILLIHQRQDRFSFGNGRMLSNEGSLDDEPGPGEYIFEAQRLEQESKRLLHELEVRTRQQLANLEQHALVSKVLQPGGRYETFAEVIAPQQIKPGDHLTIQVGIAPDIHKFHYVVLDS